MADKDRKVSEEEFISENIPITGGMTQQMVTKGNDVPENSQNGMGSSGKVDQTYWSLVKHQFRKNKLAVAAIYVVFGLVALALFADLLCNNKPIVCSFNDEIRFPFSSSMLLIWDSQNGSLNF